jgi:hypothetical protein
MKGKWNPMYTFNYDGGATTFGTLGMWLLVLALLFGLNEITRRFKWVGLFCFVVVPIILSILWFTVLKDSTLTDWFHLAKVYSSTAGCIGFWCIRHVKGKNKLGEEWHLSNYKIALCFPPLILAINIIEAVVRDFQIGIQYSGVLQILADENMPVIGGSWNYMNGIAGILNIITITGWFGIVLRRKSKKDGSRDMVWPDMLWFWIIAYDLWNFAFVYNCVPDHSWYCGLALLIAPTICNFTVGKGAWLQHRAHTLAIWCMFIQTFPAFADVGKFAVQSTHDTTALFIVSFLALASNIMVFIYMIYKVMKTKRNPYLGELYTDLNVYKKMRSQAD